MEEMVLDEQIPEVGIVYRHFKGGYYTVERIAVSADDGTTKYVVYRSHATGQYFVRPLEIWNSEADALDGSGKVKRFAKIGEDR